MRPELSHDRRSSTSSQLWERASPQEASGGPAGPTGQGTQSADGVPVPGCASPGSIQDKSYDASFTSFTDKNRTKWACTAINQNFTE